MNNCVNNRCHFWDTCSREVYRWIDCGYIEGTSNDKDCPLCEAGIERKEYNVIHMDRITTFKSVLLEITKIENLDAAFDKIYDWSKLGYISRREFRVLIGFVIESYFKEVV